MKWQEGNVDGLIGPTHNYAGLAFGNEASVMSGGKPSNPRAAALQGLQKMRLLMQLGLPQMVMPPHPRPNGRWLAALGFTGTLRKQVEQAARQAPGLLPYCYSASGMWVANAATVAPSMDTPDGKVHFTPANLISTPHRAMEAEFSARALARLFPGEAFVHHAPLPASSLLADEGAANHMRLEVEGRVLHVFAYGREQPAFTHHSTRYPARQSLQASQAVARHHGLSDRQALFVRQHPAAIDAGVFHNDVIATSNDNVLLYHEGAFAEGDAPVEALQRMAGGGLAVTRVSSAQLSMADAVRSYLFNSQVVSIPGGGMTIIAPQECHESAAAKAVINAMCASNSNTINAAHFVDLRESMSNGGGPACLRLRLPLKTGEWEQVHQGAVLTEALYVQLTAWVEKHYRDRLAPADLADPALAEEAWAALTALEDILKLKGLYES